MEHILAVEANAMMRLAPGKNAPSASAHLQNLLTPASSCSKRHIVK
jgi:hypothetical protein